MKIALDVRDFGKYPFLKESQAFLSEYKIPLDELIRTDNGKIALNHAVSRIKRALSGHAGIVGSIASLSNDTGRVRIEIASYAFSRILVSCAKDRYLISRLTQFEADRAYLLLLEENDDIIEYVASRMGLTIEQNELQLIPYVEAAVQISLPKWRLVNRSVIRGMVKISNDEKIELIRAKILSFQRQNLHQAVPGSICEEILPFIADVIKEHQEKILEQFGSVDETSYPPCMMAIITAVTKGFNIPHTARFALTAFLHTIGLSLDGIIEVFSRAPDFSIEKTQYQVEHISGRSGYGTDYTPPLCATMQTYGICTNKDSLCEKVNHPLTYYKIKKKELIKKKGEKSGLRNVNPDSSPGKNTNEDDDSSDVTGTRSYKEGENDDTKT